MRWWDLIWFFLMGKINTLNVFKRKAFHLGAGLAAYRHFRGGPPTAGKHWAGAQQVAFQGVMPQTHTVWSLIPIAPLCSEVKSRVLIQGLYSSPTSIPPCVCCSPATRSLSFPKAPGPLYASVALNMTQCQWLVLSLLNRSLWHQHNPVCIVLYSDALTLGDRETVSTGVS